jgi:hypothetical protein
MAVRSGECGCDKAASATHRYSHLSSE